MKQSLDNCTFKFFFKDECTALVKVRGGVVTCERYTDNPLRLPFGKMPDRCVTQKGLKLFFSEHCVPEHRANLQDFLDYYGLEKHDPFQICLITNGVMADSLFRLEWLDND